MTESSAAPRKGAGSAWRWLGSAGLFAAVLVWSSETCVAQPYIEWERVFGGDTGGLANSIRQTPDGGYLAAGITDSFGIGCFDAYFVKLSPNGDLDPAWPENPRTHGWVRSSELIRSVVPTRDGGYLAVGSTDLLSYSDIYVIKLAADGGLDPRWRPNPQIIVLGSDQDYSASVCESEDGGYVVAGKTGSLGLDGDVVLVKLTSDGQLDAQWPENPRVLVGRGLQRPSCVRPTSDGGFIVVGDTEAFDADGEQLFGPEVYLVKLDCDGTLDATWPENPSSLRVDDYSSGNSVVQAEDDGYVVVGSASRFVPPRSQRDALVVKFDARGVLDTGWRENPRRFGRESGDDAFAVDGTVDGGFIVAAGSAPARYRRYEVYLIKLDSAGERDPAWPQNPLSFGNGINDVPYSVDVSVDGGFVIAGESRTPPPPGTQDGYIAKLGFEAPAFVRGDADSSGRIDIADGVSVLNWLYLGAAAPECAEAADADDSGDLRLSDAVTIFAWLFGGGVPPADPAPSASEYLPDDCGGQRALAEDLGLGCLRPSATCN